VKNARHNALFRLGVILGGYLQIVRYPGYINTKDVIQIDWNGYSNSHVPIEFPSIGSSDKVISPLRKKCMQGTTVSGAHLLQANHSIIIHLSRKFFFYDIYAMCGREMYWVTLIEVVWVGKAR
jgi:hypothetical protein